MAAGEVRVKLQFDYPPPAVPESRQLWLLLSTEQCRAVTDLSCLIRERFYPQRRGALSLYLQDCLLPPGESARLLRDDDLIRVKWEEHGASQEADEPGSQAPTPRKAKKRHRSILVEDNEDEAKITNKRAKCLPDPQPTRTPQNKKIPEDRNSSESSERKKTKKKKKKQHKMAEETIPPTSPAKIARTNPSQDPSVSDQETPSAGKRPKKPKKRRQRSSLVPDEVPTSAVKTPDSSSRAAKRKETSTSSSEEDLPAPSRKPANTKAQSTRGAPGSKPANNTAPGPHGAPGNKPANTTAPSPRGAPGRSSGNRESSSSRSDSDSPKDDATQNRPVSMVTVPPLNGTSKTAAQENSSSGSDSDSFVIKKSLMAPPTIPNGLLSGGNLQQIPVPEPGVFGRGRGRGSDQPPWRGQRGGGFRGRSRGRGQQFFYSYNSEALKEMQLQEPATNVSIILQNPPEPPKKDYSSLPLLAAPPQVGKAIAFKLLELTDSYTPEVSEYKEGRILSHDPVTQQLELELLSHQKRKERGKFDLVYEDENGQKILEYAVPQDRKVTQHWSSLIEPRLVTEN